MLGKENNSEELAGELFFPKIDHCGEMTGIRN